jgi:hypothetical protein
VAVWAFVLEGFCVRDRKVNRDGHYAKQNGCGHETFLIGVLEDSSAIIAQSIDNGIVVLAIH